MDDIAQARAACQELRIRTALPGYRSAGPWGQISDPIYAAVLALATPEPGAALSPAFADPATGVGLAASSYALRRVLHTKRQRVGARVPARRWCGGRAPR